jgi:hypothetical protein
MRPSSASAAAASESASPSSSNSTAAPQLLSAAPGSSSRSLAAAVIDATSQLSRFHLESVDPSTSIKGIDLHQVRMNTPSLGGHAVTLLLLLLLL